jgi:predicted small integral membrane protein
MKQLIMMLATIFLSMHVFAQWQYNNNRGGSSYNRTGYLKIQTVNTDGFFVSINDAYTQQSYSNSMVLNNITSGNTTIEVYTLKRGYFGQTRKQILYRDNVFMRPGMGTFISIDTWGRANVSYNGSNDWDNTRFDGDRCDRDRNRCDDNRCDKHYKKYKKHRKYRNCGNDERGRDYDDYDY